MFGRDKQDQPYQTTTDNSQNDSTGTPVFMPEPEELDNEGTSMQESVNAVMSQEPAAPQASTPPVAESAPNFIMTSAPTPSPTNAPADNDEPEEEEQEPSEPAEESQASFAVPVNVSKPEVPAPEAPTSDSDLDAIKNQALKSLAPLVDHLDQDPEEKFSTIMMMLEASQDNSLVKAAYEAANAISDETAKSKALLEVIAKIDAISK